MKQTGVIPAFGHQGSRFSRVFFNENFFNENFLEISTITKKDRFVFLQLEATCSKYVPEFHNKSDKYFVRC